LARRQRRHQLRDVRQQPLAPVPVAGEVADRELPAAHEDPEPGPAEPAPLGQLDAIVEPGTGGRQLAQLLADLGVVVQGP
jgi:hypothetical protein